MNAATGRRFNTTKGLQRSQIARTAHNQANTAREECRVVSATPRSTNRTSMIAFVPTALSGYDRRIAFNQPPLSPEA